MFDAENASMASGPVSERAEVARSSSAAGEKAGNDSPRSGRSYLALRGRRQFAKVFRNGVRSASGGVTVIKGPTRGGQPAVGIVTSKRNVGGAVDRNRAKRRLREALDVLQLENRSYIVIASRPVVRARFEAVVRWLEDALQKESTRE